MPSTWLVTLRAWIITTDVSSSTTAAIIVNFMLCRKTHEQYAGFFCRQVQPCRVEKQINRSRDASSNTALIDFEMDGKHILALITSLIEENFDFVSNLGVL